MENKYKKQIKQISEKEYTDGYNDAAGGKRNKYVKEKPVTPQKRDNATFKNVKVGDIIKFGNYPQYYSYTKEPIEWRVLDVREGKALLISKYGLDCKRYNKRPEYTPWEKCTLRRWLNSDFLNSAFSNVEKNTILLSTVIADNNPFQYSIFQYSTYQGLDAEDKIFILSVKEAEQYFKSNMDRKCYPTKIAVDNGVGQYDGGPCWWWLRSSGKHTTGVNTTGSVDFLGNIVYDVNRAVRPALWINLKS